MYTLTSLHVSKMFAKGLKCTTKKDSLKLLIEFYLKRFVQKQPMKAISNLQAVGLDSQFVYTAKQSCNKDITVMTLYITALKNKNQKLSL